MSETVQDLPPPRMWAADSVYSRFSEHRLLLHGDVHVELQEQQEREEQRVWCTDKTEEHVNNTGDVRRFLMKLIIQYLENEVIAAGGDRLLYQLTGEKDLIWKL